MQGVAEQGKRYRKGNTDLKNAKSGAFCRKHLSLHQVNSRKEGGGGPVLKKGQTQPPPSLHRPRSGPDASGQAQESAGSWRHWVTYWVSYEGVGCDDGILLYKKENVHSV